MKNIELNQLTTNQRRVLQVGVAIVLVVFLAGFFLLRKSPTPEPERKNETVYIQDSTLYVVDDTISIAEYPSRVAVHYPYLLVILPKQQVTHVYNLEEKKKERDFSETILDYAGGKVLRNGGKTTLLDTLDLGVLCDKGFIQSSTEVLCLTRVTTNNVENKVISISIPDKKQKEVYVSGDIITDFSVINGQVYIGEINLHNKQNYLLIDGEKTEVPSVVSFIYEMGGEPHFATLKGALSEQEVYYQINNDRINLVSNDLIMVLK